MKTIFSELYASYKIDERLVKSTEYANQNAEKQIVSGNNRALFIPFDNDKWIRYQSHPVSSQKLTSYEVISVNVPLTEKELLVSIGMDSSSLGRSHG